MSDPSQEPSIEGRLILLDKALSPLQDRFNAGADQRRVLLILSPTWGGCVYAARGAEKSILKSRAGADLRVHIIWVPMLPGDDKDAADKIGATISDPAVRQYWDPNRLCGTAYTKHTFPKWRREMVSSLPEVDNLREYLKPRIDAPPEKAPMWDIAFLYEAGARWTDNPPKPDRWAKQVMFYGKQTDGPTGRFWRNDFAKPPFDSDWYDELARWTKGRGGSHRASVKVSSLADSLDPLQHRFNKDKGKNRFIAILSPTWPACVSGTRAVLKSVLLDFPNTDISVSIVWIDMLPSDNAAAAKQIAKTLDDPRVRHFHDPRHTHRAGKAFARGLLYVGGGPAWDMYLFYGKGDQWKDRPPRPTEWMHQLSGGKRADATRFRTGKELVDQLHEAMHKVTGDLCRHSSP